MAYGLKYTIQAKGFETGIIFKCELWEKDYAGGNSAVELDQNPFIHQLLASSDDPFQAFLASSLTVRTDITTFPDTLPDFVSMDDRKYHVKMYADSTLIWQGFTLNDNVTVPFQTGFVGLEFTCTDGIGMLKDMPFVPTDLNETLNISLDEIIRKCLTNIGYPDGYYVNYAVNIFAAAMAETTPFTQTYLNSGLLSTRNCYEILEDICTSFGAQLFQSGGEWWIMSVNERAASTIRYVRVSESGTVESVATLSNRVTIDPFPAAYYFVDAGQRKILRKGFSWVELKRDWQFKDNYLDNAALTRLDGNGFADGFNRVLTGGATIFMQRFNNAEGIKMDVSGAGNREARFTNKTETLFRAFKGNKMKINFDYEVLIAGATENKGIGVFASITDGVSTYYLKGGDNDYYYWDGTTGYAYVSQNQTTASITTAEIPISGTVEFRLQLINNGANSTGLQANIGNIAVSYETPKQSVIISANLDGNRNKFKKEITIPYTDQGLPDGATVTGAWWRVKYIQDGTGDLITRYYIYVTGVVEFGYYFYGTGVPPFPSSVAYGSLTFQSTDVDENLIDNDGTITEVTLMDESSTITGFPAQPSFNDNTLRSSLLDSSGNSTKAWGFYGGSKTLTHMGLMLQIFTRVLFRAQINIEGAISMFITPEKTVTLTDATGKYSVSGKGYIQGNMSTDYVGNTTDGIFLEVNNMELIENNLFQETVNYGN